MPHSIEDNIGMALAPVVPEESVPLAPRASLPDRYVELGILGRGGMGEVHRVFDTVLNRSVAIKIMQQSLTQSADRRARFLTEARATAFLQHPGIVPIYDCGVLADGRPYYTMKEIHGVTLRDAIQNTYSPSASRRTGMNLIGLLEVFQRVCDAVAFAHSREIVHCDLKPSNIMVAEFGETLIVDWGLAQIVLPPQLVQDGDPIEKGAYPESPGHSDPFNHGKRFATKLHVEGSPAYMAPERARGELRHPTQTSDVYSLGAILYEILSGRPPFVGAQPREVLHQAAYEAPAPLTELLPGADMETRTLSDFGIERAEYPSTESSEFYPFTGIPEQLREICERAMHRDPTLRYASAREVSIELHHWLDGEARRVKARQSLQEALQCQSTIKQLWDRVDQYNNQSNDILASMDEPVPEEARFKAWQFEDLASQTALQAEKLGLEFVLLLRNVLHLDPKLHQASDHLSNHFASNLVRAESDRDSRRVVHYEALLRDADTKGGFAPLLRGDAVVSLVTNPAHAFVEVFEFREVNRRLVLAPFPLSFETPVTDVTLAKGSYLFQISSPGRITVPYPVFLTRGGRWDGIRPGSESSYPIYLPLQTQLSTDECYVPAGWYLAGGDPLALNGLRARRLWVDPFVVKKFPVTHADYITFLDHLVDMGREEEALQAVPRERTTGSSPPPMLYGRRSDGHFFMQPDKDGDIWPVDWPAFLVSFHNAVAYAQWYANQTGLPWRLPCELEWEKGARGVDGRIYPWGRDFTPTWTRMSGSDSRLEPAPIHSYELDCSVYGVRGLGGNVRDWCADIFRPGGPPTPNDLVIPCPSLSLGVGDEVINRGGEWHGSAIEVRSASRFRLQPGSRFGYTGFRLARSL